MPISRIEIRRVAMPLLSPWATAYGSDDAIHSVLVRIDSDGVHAWGEACPLQFPFYSPEWAKGVFETVRAVIAPRVIGREIASGAELQELLAAVRGNPFAKAAVDTAWWALHAKQQGQPLWRVIGGSSESIDVGADFGVMPRIDDLLEGVSRACAAGFKRIKLKFRRGWDVDVVAAVRSAFPNAVFHIDCNGGFTTADQPMFRKLEKYDLAMIEQPLAYDDLIDHAHLQKNIGTPICLDESITSADKARKAVSIGACRWVNLKPGRVGGITPLLAINRICQDAGVPCWIGGMLESGVGASVCQALATLPNIGYPNDVFPSDRFYARDLATPPLTLSGPSQMTLSPTPGTGVEPDPRRLEELTLETASLVL